MIWDYISFSLSKLDYHPFLCIQLQLNSSYFCTKLLSGWFMDKWQAKLSQNTHVPGILLLVKHWLLNFWTTTFLSHSSSLWPASSQNYKPAFLAFLITAELRRPTSWNHKKEKKRLSALRKQSPSNLTACVFHWGGEHLINFSKWILTRHIGLCLYVLNYSQAWHLSPLPHSPGMADLLLFLLVLNLGILKFHLCL